MYMFVR